MSPTLPEKVRWTTADLELLAADEWKQYEIIDGELFVTEHLTSAISLCCGTFVVRSINGPIRRSWAKSFQLLA